MGRSVGTGRPDRVGAAGSVGRDWVGSELSGIIGYCILSNALRLYLLLIRFTPATVRSRKETFCKWSVVRPGPPTLLGLP